MSNTNLVFPKFRVLISTILLLLSPISISTFLFRIFQAPDTPFPAPAPKFREASAAEFGFTDENGGGEAEDSEIYYREGDDEVRLTVDMLDRPWGRWNLNSGLSLGFVQGDEVADGDFGEGIGGEIDDVAREVDLELMLGLGSEYSREANTFEFGRFFGEELNFTDSERIAGFDGCEFCQDVVHPVERNNAYEFRVCYDHFVLLDEHLDHVSQLGQERAFLYDWYGVRDEHDVPVQPDLYYGDGINWETLLAVNYMYRDVDVDQDLIDGVVEESMNEWRGNPLAAKFVVEALPIVRLSCDDLRGEELSCAICFFEFSVGMKVRELPCLHYFHGECILPWLDLRNTCPVCRFELPIEDDEQQGWETEG